MLALAFVRCPHAHATVGAIDAAAARALPGVAAVLTAEDLETEPLSPGLTGQGFVPTAWPALAAAEVEYGGQAVAIVAAESASIAADARALVRWPTRRGAPWPASTRHWPPGSCWCVAPAATARSRPCSPTRR